MKIPKKNNKHVYYFNSAIDIAIKSNQPKAVSLIINYIVKYQNNYVSSFLFFSNMHKIMEKGIPVYPLLDSNVFLLNFDFDEWPQIHLDNSHLIMPYHGSIFEIR